MTDVVGSSRLAEQEPGKYLALLRAHDALIRSEVEKHEGEFIRERGEGDSTFSVFANPDNAIDCAAQIVGLLKSDLAEISVRLAIHSGTASRVDFDYRGDAPNRCARIRSLAHPGQILVSGATAALSTKKERLVSIGRVALKSLAEKVEIFQVVASETDRILKVQGIVRHNLPAQIAPLVPRPKLVNELLDTLRAYRLVVLEGVVGVGKSTLMQLAGREAIPLYPGGVWLLPASQGSPASLFERLARAMDIDFSRETDLFRCIVGNIGSEQSLILADGVNEAPLTFAAEAERLLGALPSLRLIVAADRRLDVADAKRFVVPPMRSDRSGEALDYAYRRLDQLGIALPNDRQAEQEFERLLELLGGLPLAIELILPRLQVMSPAQVGSRVQTLVSRSHKTKLGDQPPKYDSVRSAILASLDGLTAEAQLLAKQLAVLPGAFDLEMVVELYETDSRDDLDIAEYVEEIVRANLLQRKQVGSTTFFEWLPVIRLSLLDEGIDVTEVIQRLLPWAAKRSGQLLSGALNEQPFEASFANLKYALAQSASDSTASDVTQILKAMRRVWLNHGPIAEALETHLQAEKQIPTDPSARGDILNGAGIFAWYSGDFERARAFYLQALTYWESAENKRGQGATLNNLGLLALSRMEFREARDSFASALRTFDEIGLSELSLIARQNLAGAELRMEPGGAMLRKWRDLLVDCRDDELGRLNLLSFLFESAVLGKESPEEVLGWLRLIHIEGNRWVNGTSAFTILCALTLWLSHDNSRSEDPAFCRMLVHELSYRTGMFLDATHQSVLALANLGSVPEALLPEYESVAEVRWAALDFVEMVLIGAAGGLIESLDV